MVNSNRHKFLEKLLDIALLIDWVSEHGTIITKANDIRICMAYVNGHVQLHVSFPGDLLGVTVNSSEDNKVLEIYNTVVLQLKADADEQKWKEAYNNISSNKLIYNNLIWKNLQK